VFEVFRATTPVVEGLSIDEAFLDLTGLRRVSGSPEAIAAHLRRAVHEHVGLRITVGGAGTKFLAKVASRVAKPDGLLVVAPGRRRRSMGAQRALGRGRRPTEEIAAMLDSLVDGVARRLRAARVVGHTVVLRVRFDDFTRATRSSTLAMPTADTQPLRLALRHLPHDAQPTTATRALPLVGTAASRRTDADAVARRLPLPGSTSAARHTAPDTTRPRAP